ncbi:DUF6090 family protein [Yeosuana sp. MJ-SS3]|uniref:DUF6090 family protein n=1 Tax=Gilvirhabdus luticola TaxID=3079858 RepID=A0ABU3U7M1_9FLAO|nr:DUF6090 family protein [Yeosuana sp. MJ-SS3]MDU8886405.1 DUF6090 family protein [Yeosuana sp. MJ-SS3]
MIKLFNKIRHHLLTENKFSKYLVYAIGEIILVVIGILIALQVNNWNNERKEQLDATELSKSLIAELEGIKWYAGQRLNIMENQRKLIQYVINTKEIKKDSVLSITDSLGFPIEPLNFIFTFKVHYNPRDDVYRSALNDGTLSIIKPKWVVNDLNVAYSMSTKRLSDHAMTENEIIALINEHVSNEYQDLFSLNQIKDEIGSWDDEVTNTILQKISTDGKLKYLLSSRLQVLQFKWGDLKYVVLRRIEKALELLKENAQ